jgi:hypothetical protein
LPKLTVRWVHVFLVGPARRTDGPSIHPSMIHPAGGSVGCCAPGSASRKRRGVRQSSSPVSLQWSLIEAGILGRTMARVSNSSPRIECVPGLPGRPSHRLGAEGLQGEVDGRALTSDLLRSPARNIATPCAPLAPHRTLPSCILGRDHPQRATPPPLLDAPAGAQTLRHPSPWLPQGSPPGSPRSRRHGPPLGVGPLCAHSPARRARRGRSR